jgi:hypothetical protein
MDIFKHFNIIKGGEGSKILNRVCAKYWGIEQWLLEHYLNSRCVQKIEPCCSIPKHEMSYPCKYHHVYTIIESFMSCINNFDFKELPTTFFN